MINAQEIRFKVTLDDSAVPPSAARTATGLQQVGRGAQQASAALAGIGQSSKLTARELQMLSFQTTDIVTSLVSGQSPFIVLLQQGGQLRDQFGSTGAVLRAFGSQLSVVRVAAGGAAAVLGVLGFAAYRGSEQVDAMNRALALNGNAAGLTAGRVEELAQQLAALPGSSIGKARDALQEMAATGAFAGENLLLAGRAALAMSRLNGQSAAEIVGQLAKMRSGVADWAAEANRSYNFLTPDIYRHIAALEKQGDSTAAVKVALTQLANTMETRAAPAVGYLQTIMEGASKVADKFWDSLLAVGRPLTIEQQLAKVQQQIAETEAAMASPLRGGKRRSTQQADLDELRGRQASLQEMQRMETRVAEQRARVALENQKAIEDERKRNSGAGLSEARQRAEAVLGLEAAQQARSLAILELSGKDKLRELQRQYEQFEITGAEYVRTVETLAREEAAAKVKAAEADVQRVMRRPAQDAASVIQRETARVQAETKLAQARAEAAAVEADIAAGKFLATPRDVVEEPGAALRRSELTTTQDLARQWDERVIAARLGAQSLVEENRRLGIDLIRDDRERAAAQLDLEEDQLRKRIDLAVLGADERQRVEDELANWRIARERQVTEQLKPQWQRDAELWADTTRYMRERYDEFLGSFVTNGREAFSEWVRDGRLSARSLAGFIKGEFARLAYERFLATYVRSAGDWLFKSLLGAADAFSGVQALPDGGGVTIITGGSGSGLPDDLPTRGGLAYGGSVPPASAWIVGERGPEKLVMGRSGGVVVPNMGMQQQQPVTVHQHFSITGKEDTATLYRLAALTRESAIAGVAEARARGNPAFG